MNATPPDDMWTYDSAQPSRTSSEKDVGDKAELARRAVSREYPGEGGKDETDIGKATWKQLGIGKDGKK